jgi:hypothetical protein
MEVSDTILAAMMAAGATLVTAFIHLLNYLRAGKAMNARSARGGMRSLLWMVAMMAAAAVGGFAYAEYRAMDSRNETQVLRTELQQQLQALSASTARLEQLRVNGSLEPDSRAAEVRQQGLDGVAAIVSLPACKGPQVGFATERGNCTEQDAMQVAVCAPVPAAAKVSAVELFARPEDSQQPWTETRVAAGQDLGGGRFAVSHFERVDGDGTKQVCQSYSHWSNGKGRIVRILVRYVV